MTTEGTALIRAQHQPEHERLGLSADQVLRMYRTMVLARRLDERQWILNRQGKQAFVISCQGHEASGVGSASALQPGLDLMCPYYRSLPAVLVFGSTARDVLLEGLSRAEGPWTGGRQMPAHFGDVRYHILTSGSPVATQIVHAAGAALAAKIRGDGAVAIAYFGEGATSKGDFHEGLNFAAIHRLPAIFFCENNGYAISTPLGKQMAVPNVADRGPAYGMPGVVVDGNDLLAVYRVTRQAAERARRGEGPTLIEAKVYRLTPHSSDDDDRRYRAPSEVEEARKAEPLIRMRRYLEEQSLLDERQEAAIQESVAAEIEAALAYAEQAPLPAPTEARRHVFQEAA
ncbi:MAG: thiamine pyrophosphate-dependent dehydrogenase E1 component subunit alpha [Chloroflexi bacterium]|nr:thiamine pyrophosphate-dependent dehydrogenase E1 component subunit alpha [Chloroflexota bacterium]